MKLLIYSSFIFLLSNIINAQDKLDLGVLVGGNYYQGDLNSSTLMRSPNIAGGILVKYNVNPRYSVRMSIYMGGLSASDNSSKYIYQQQRGHSFATNLIDYTLQTEFNFYEFVPEDPDIFKRFSPYVTAGFTFFIASSALKPYQPAIPFGVGIKYAPNRKMTIGAEWAYRKTFTDYIDLISGNKDEISSFNTRYGYKQIGYYHENDWYSLVSVFLTYKIKTKKDIPCPAYW